MRTQELTPQELATVEQAVRELKRFSRNDSCPRPVVAELLRWWGGTDQLTAAARDAVLSQFPAPAEREPFSVDYFLEDLGEHPPLPLVHRIVASGKDANGVWFAHCLCPWNRTGYFSPAVLAMAVDEHLQLHAAAVLS